MIVLVSLRVLLRELLVSLFSWCIPTSPFIPLNDFYTCFAHFASRIKHSYAHAYVSAVCD